MADSSVADSEGVVYDSKPLVTSIKDTILTPPRLLFARTALRTYLRTLLLFIASIALFATATTAYASFYYAYVPTRGFTLPVHLAFDDSYLDACGDSRGSNGGGGVLESVVGHKHASAKWVAPAGTVALGKGSLATEQKYDISVELDLPRSEQNLGIGNFMVEVTLLGVGWEGYEATKEGVVLASARRPAMLTYRSWLVEMAWRVTRLPWYLIGWRVESEKVGVKVLDGVQFEKGRRNTPESVRVEVRSGRGKVLQIYRVSVEFRTRFEGLRYIMYNYRIISLLLFTALFWTVEMAFLLVTWGLFTLLFSRSTPPAQNQPKREPQDSTAIKPDPEGTEESDATGLEYLSDASHTFPTYSRQPPLRYSAPRVKEEYSERALEDLPPRTPGDADDEDEEEDEDADFVLDETPGMGGVPSDSGLGTSMESGMESRGLLRRRSGGSVSGKRRE